MNSQNEELDSSGKMPSDLASERSQKEASQSGYLAEFQPWLRLMAGLQLDSKWDRKFDASDIIQQTLLEAWKAEPNFEGDTKGQRIAWLRTILGRVISRQIRHYTGNEKRDPARELALQNSLNQSSMMLERMVTADEETPSVHADNREQQMIIADVLEALDEDHRRVIVLRNLQGLSHAEVAIKLGRTESAVRMLWLRALKQLRLEVLSRQ
ncbi:MAG: sigma-70 family RNA polymerase sigma factor [Mariniblastus sp.]